MLVLGRTWVRVMSVYLRRRDGASAAEYALMLTVLGGCAIVVLHALGKHMGMTFNTMSNVLGP